MKLMLITQNDPFYLHDALDYFFKKLPSNFKVVGAVVLSPSPFGKKLSNFQKFISTYQIFGYKFTFYYSIKLLLSKIKRKNVNSVLNKHNIEIIKLAKSINANESLELIESFNPDILLSIAGNEIFRKPLIDLAPLGCLNLHTALLPKYRGLMPSFWVLKNKEEFTGVSVFYVDEGIDSGPIITQKKIPIVNLSQDELIRKSKKIGMQAIIESLLKIKNKSFKLQDNNAEEMTYFSFPTKKDVKEFYDNGAKFF
tara:strand:- start:217 stop:978 length:762 start_codon:yes stop_codon:yes gene_type:complete